MCRCTALQLCVCILRKGFPFFEPSKQKSVQVCGGMCVFRTVTLSNASGRLCLLTWEGGRMEGEGERGSTMIDKVTPWKESMTTRVIIFSLPVFCMYTISLFAQRTKACEWYLMIVKRKCLVSYSFLNPSSVLFYPLKTFVFAKGEVPHCLWHQHTGWTHLKSH